MEKTDSALHRKTACRVKQECGHMGADAHQHRNSLLLLPPSAHGIEPGGKARDADWRQSPAALEANHGIRFRCVGRVHLRAFRRAETRVVIGRDHLRGDTQLGSRPRNLAHGKSPRRRGREQTHASPRKSPARAGGRQRGGVALEGGESSVDRAAQVKTQVGRAPETRYIFGSQTRPEQANLKDRMAPTEQDILNLRASLKRCSNETVEAAVRFRLSGDAKEIPPIVYGIIERHLSPEHNRSLSSAGDETRLIEDLGIDSLTLLEIVLSIEETLGISIENEELREILTLGQVKTFIARKISGGGEQDAGKAIKVRRYTREDIALRLPQQPPFFFLDDAQIDGNIVRARYRLRGDEFFLEGHFKDNPVMPASIVFEAIGQAGLSVGAGMRARAIARGVAIERSPFRLDGRGAFLPASQARGRVGPRSRAGAAAGAAGDLPRQRPTPGRETGADRAPGPGFRPGSR